DGIHAVNQPAAFRLFVRSIGVVVLFGGSRLHFPEFNLRPFLALANLPAVLGSLTIGHPARIIEAATNTRRHQMNAVSAAVAIPGRRIEWHPSRFPRFLPRRYTLLQHPNDGIGDLLSKVPFRLRCRLAGCHAASSGSCVCVSVDVDSNSASDSSPS